MASLNIENLKADLTALHGLAVVAHDALIELRGKLATAIGLAENMPDNSALQAELDGMDSIVRAASTQLADAVGGSVPPTAPTAPTAPTGTVPAPHPTSSATSPVEATATPD